MTIPLQETKQQFLEELQELCDKYNMHISSTMYGDLAIFPRTTRYSIDEYQNDLRYTKIKTDVW